MVTRIRFFRLFFLLALGVLLFQIGSQYRHFLWATFHECFTKWQFALPQAGGEFYVRNNAPRAMQRIITRAFPEYKVIFSSESASPHLILKEYYTPTHKTHTR